MAEHEFSEGARAHFRRICQEDAYKREMANYGSETPLMRERYEWAWRASYAQYVGENVVMQGERCDRCGMVVSHDSPPPHEDE